jgi:hypothetical protein
MTGNGFNDRRGWWVTDGRRMVKVNFEERERLTTVCG